MDFLKDFFEDDDRHIYVERFLNQELNYQLLKTIVEPKTRVLELWESTYNYRKDIFKNYSIEEIFDEVPVLKTNIGSELINTDFNEKHPDTIDNIYLKWPKLSSAILKEVDQRKVKVIENATDIDSSVVALLTLPFLIPPVTLKRSKDFNWRPSRTEIQESFFFHVNKIEDVNEILLRRKRKLAWANSTLQPFGLMIGPLNMIEEYRVYLGDDCVIRGSQTSGVGTDGVYKPTWWCFDLLLFLNDADPVRPSTTNLEVTQGSTNEDDGNVIFEGTMDQLQHQLQSPSSSSRATPEPPTKKRKTSIQSNALEIMKIASERLAQGRKEVEDDISTFGLMVATELRKIKKKDILRKLKKDIFNLILDMQQLDEDQEY
ncbi:hypothetical protein FQR65_LT17468 [Abscondita terminalis]|nr:hypothetical protein FQR65_LT17468 [Abscondita terminalis]